MAEDEEIKEEIEFGGEVAKDESTEDSPPFKDDPTTKDTVEEVLAKEQLGHIMTTADHSDFTEDEDYWP